MKGTDPKRVKAVLKRLNATYPDVKCALTHDNAWQLLVATILSAQCTDVRVNKVTPELFRKHPTVHDLAAVRREVLEQDIRSTGFFRNKAKSITGAAQRLVAEFGGQVPCTMEELLTLPGVARKTANVVLGTAFGIAAGVVVDTHVQRIAGRLDLSRQKTPEKIEQDLMRVVPKNQWIDFSHRMIWHGRLVCAARRPNCPVCPLNKLCHAKENRKRKP
jgi:endonuclease-3